jgi:hypothetical protein
MRRLFHRLAIFFAIASVVAPALAWFLGWIVILAAGGGEYHAIRDSDQPASYKLLTFGPWQTGAGPCSRSHIQTLPRDTKIIAYRVGNASGIITKMEYYEAKYQMPDGTVRVTHASGPIPLISHRKDTLIVCLLCFALIAASLFFASSRMKSRNLTASSFIVQAGTIEADTK